MRSVSVTNLRVMYLQDSLDPAPTAANLYQKSTAASEVGHDQLAQETQTSSQQFEKTKIADPRIKPPARE